MKTRGRSFYIRKAHRYLGVFIGIQFLLWTLGGLYFSWTVLDEIHGDHLRHELAAPDPATLRIPPHEAIATYSDGTEADLSKFRIVAVMGEAFYAITYGKGESARSILVNAASGRPRHSITEVEAKAIALSTMHKQYEVETAAFVTRETVGGHHEYREKPLPAWAVTFRHPENATVYIGAIDGQVHAVRTDNWRAFDLLWMLHTMDFAGRDNINNYVLRAFSVLGILTVLSGFLLYFTSSKTIRRITRKR